MLGNCLFCYEGFVVVFFCKSGRPLFQYILPIKKHIWSNMVVNVV